MNIDVMQLGIELQTACQANAPVRTKPPSGPSGKSPYPGNLRQNGINIESYSSNYVKVVIGGEPAPYGPYTETKSHKPGWINKSINEFSNMIVTKYGGIRKQ